MREELTVVGIDPGKKGALAVINGNRSIDIYPMPLVGKGRAAELDMAVVLNIISDADMVVIEKVHAMPKQGVVSMFSFGLIYGQLLGLARCIGKPIINPTPQQWKGVVLKSYNKKDKSSSIKYCKFVYPKVDLKRTQRSFKDDDNFADALCLADYGFMRYKDLVTDRRNYGIQETE